MAAYRHLDCESDSDDIPDNWEDELSDDNEVDLTPEIENGHTVCSVDKPDNWRKYLHKHRKIRQLPKVLQDAKARLYIEPKTKKPNKKDQKDQDGTAVPQIDKRFDGWQRDMAQALIDGHHVILDVTTSCGKTWAVRNTLAELVLRNDSTAIIVTPNWEILQENIRGLLTDNRKTYQRPGKTITGFQTRKINYVSDKHTPSCQILCMTAENVTSFMSASANKEFIDKLAYVVLDEVHTDDVTHALWRLCLIPPGVQFVLLSATIGNTDWLSTELHKYRPDKTTHVIQWHIRPIPLQRGVFPSSLLLSDGGARITADKSNLLFSPNPNDPTDRDISVLEGFGQNGTIGPDTGNTENPKSEDVRVEKEVKGRGKEGKAKEAKPKEKVKSKKEQIIEANLKAKGVKPQKDSEPDRTDRFKFGQKMVNNLGEDGYNKLKDHIETIIDHSLDLDAVSSEKVPATVLSMLQYVHSAGLGPGLFFSSDPSAVVILVKKILGLLQNLEDQDKDVRRQIKEVDRALKEARRKRDDSPERRHVNNEDDFKKLNMVEIPSLPDKWRFTIFTETIPKKTPGWIVDLLKYGIGIYTYSMSGWLKEIMFEWFAQRKLAFIFCDRSLSLGINLPVRSVILSGDVDKTLFEQMGGRAGRRGYDNEGYVFLATGRDRMRTLLHGVAPVRNIQSMTNLSMVDILRWYSGSSNQSAKSNHQFQKGQDKDAISRYVANYNKLSLDEKYEEKVNWLASTGWLTSKYTNLALSLDNPTTMLLLHLIRKGSLDKMLYVDKTRDFNETCEPFLNLLCYLWEPVITSDESAKLAELDPDIAIEIEQLAGLFGLDLPIRKTCSNYIFQYMKNNTINSSTRYMIDKFQHHLYDLLLAVREMSTLESDKDKDKDEKKENTDDIFVILDKIDKRLY